MVRAPKSRREGLLAGSPQVGGQMWLRKWPERALRAEANYFAPLAAAYFLRNLSTRPAVSTIFCLPV